MHNEGVKLGGGIVLATLLSGCALHCTPEKVEPPSEAKFFTDVIHFRPSGAPDSLFYPIWRSNSEGERIILLLHALNGLSPGALNLALKMEEWGHRVYVPSLVGDSLGKYQAFGLDKPTRVGIHLKNSNRWELRSPKGTGIGVDDVRQMVREISRREGGKPVVVIGNCFTGSLPIALLDEAKVEKVVIAQPALPMKSIWRTVLKVPAAKRERFALALSDEQLNYAASSLVENPNKRIYGFHYLNDPVAPIERFDVIKEWLEGIDRAECFKTFVLGEREEVSRIPEGTWTKMGVTEERKRFTTPHSTIINAEKDDRVVFQRWLREILVK